MVTVLTQTSALTLILTLALALTLTPTLMWPVSDFKQELNCLLIVTELFTYSIQLSLHLNNIIIYEQY